MSDAKANIVQQLAELQWSRVAVGGLVLTILYWAALFDDGSQLIAQTTAARQEQAQKEKELQDAKTELANADQFELKVKEMASQFEKIVEFMPENMSIADLTAIATEQASRAGLKLMKTEPNSSSQAGSEQAGFYTTTKLNITLEGGFSEIATFLSNVTKIPRLLTFQNLELASTAEADPERPKLIVTGTLVGYKYSRPKSQTDPTQAQGAQGSVQQ